MRRTVLLLALAATLTASLIAPVLHAEDSAAPAGEVPACVATQQSQAAPAGSAEPALGVLSPVQAATCPPSPLCPGSACDTDCRQRGARFGICTADLCCVCFWKI